jgi:hypothetical protein
MNTSRRLLIVAALGSASLAGVAAETQSMKDEARARGGTFTNLIDITVPAPSFPDMVRASDLIVRGRVARRIARLSDDESMVFTEYAITPVRVLKRPGELASSDVPGEPPTITLWLPGGILVVDGLRLQTQSMIHDPNRDFAVGDEYVLFLVRAVPSGATTNQVPRGAFEPASGQFAVFSIRGEKVQGFTRINPARKGPTSDNADEFLASIQQMVQIADKEKRTP